MSATLHSFEPDRFDKNREPGRSDPADESPSEMDPRIREVLVGLPRETASAQFTVRVLERTGAKRTRGRRLRSLAAAAAFCVFGAVGAHQWNEGQIRHAETERVARLQLEYHMLQQELLELERAADRRRPVVYLGSQGDVEYVIDLSRLPTRSQPTRSQPTRSQPTWSQDQARPSSVRTAAH